jgi:hypothetical protein
MDVGVVFSVLRSIGLEYRLQSKKGIELVSF